MKAYILFHLNLDFSSIPEKNREKVVNDCYEPLIKLSNNIFPIHIELSAYTLEVIKKIRPILVKKILEQIKKKNIVIVESGYKQIIGPITPYNINQLNLKYGKKIYKRILGKNSKIALINEMSFSDSLVRSYVDNKYDCLILDGDSYQNISSRKILPNCYLYNKNKIQIYWGSSLIFQKFQDYVLGNCTKKDYFNLIQNKKKQYNNLIPLYSSDAEIFNYRPGRFYNESEKNVNEWKRIEEIFYFIKKKVELVNLEQVNIYEHLSITQRLCNGSQPILVKKQKKYNIIRWGLSGRRNQYLNSITFLINHYKKKLKLNNKNILELFASDLRTHITSVKFNKVIKKINFYKKKIRKYWKKDKESSNALYIKKNNFFNYSNEGAFLNFKNKFCHLTLNCNKGLALESLAFKKKKFKPIIGTIHKDYWNTLDGADFYSGNLTCNNYTFNHKFSDLKKILPKFLEDNNYFIIKASIKNNDYILTKKIYINKKIEEIRISYNFKAKDKCISSIRTCHLTFLNVDKKSKIIYLSNNGGNKMLKNYITTIFDHTQSVSHMVSANNALGCTNGELIYVNHTSKLKLQWDQHLGFAMPMIQNIKINKKRLFRIIFSQSEVDDTSKLEKKNVNFNLSIKPI